MLKHVSTINVKIHVHQVLNVANVPSAWSSIMSSSVAARMDSLETRSAAVRCHCNVVIPSVSVMNRLNSVRKVVEPMNNVRVVKCVLLASVAHVVIQAIALVNCAKMEPVLLDAATIWIVRVIVPVSMASVLIHV